MGLKALDDFQEESARGSCTALHGVRCNETFHARSASVVVSMAKEHGAHAHGFTPVYYSPVKLDAMLASVVRAHR